MFNFKSIIFCLILLIFYSCKKSSYHIYSLNKKQCITILDEGNIRYIVNGKHSSIPNNGYLKLNTNNIDPIGDVLFGCWNENGYDWVITNPKATIIENKLDTMKFKYNIGLPIDYRGVPDVSSYRKINCFVLDFSLERLVPERGAIVE